MKSRSGQKADLLLRDGGPGDNDLLVLLGEQTVQSDLAGQEGLTATGLSGQYGHFAVEDDLFGPLLLFIQADPELDRVFGLSLLLEYWVFMRFDWHVE